MKKSKVEFVPTEFSACWDLPLDPTLKLSETGHLLCLFQAFWEVFYASQCQIMSTSGTQQPVGSYKQFTVCGWICWAWLCMGGAGLLFTS